MKFAMISRHEPTAEQIKMAKEQGVEIEHLGDHDAFTISAGVVYDAGDYEGFIVVHPAAAMRLCSEFLIGVFERKGRDQIGLPADDYIAEGFHIYDRRD